MLSKNADGFDGMYIQPEFSSAQPQLQIADSFVVAVTSIPELKPFVAKKLYVNYLGQCSCVEYIKARLGWQGSFGNASQVKPTTQVPEVGSVILFKSHVGYVTGYDGFTVTYDDYNYISCTERKDVKIQASDPDIRGYFVKETTQS